MYALRRYIACMYFNRKREFPVSASLTPLFGEEGDEGLLESAG